MADPQPTQAMMDARPTDDGMMDAKPTDDSMMDARPTDDGMMDAKPTDDGMMDARPTDDGMMDAMPSWLKLTLTDVRTGENFSLADFAGKVVLVHNMAAWCPNCLAQQKQIKLMLQQTGKMDDLVVIGLGVDSNEDAALLKSYADQNGFDWKYAVATREVAKEISTLYGAQFLNPSPTPMMIIDRRGKVFLQDFGIKAAEKLQKALEPHLSKK